MMTGGVESRRAELHGGSYFVVNASADVECVLLELKDASCGELSSACLHDVGAVEE